MDKNIKKYTISIERAKNKFMDFKLEMDSSLTVLDALDEIRYNIDPSLEYRHSCHHGSCGTCACIINDVERLACMTFLNEFADNKISIKPLNNFKVISDLVVDISSMVKNMPEGTYLRDSELSKDSLKPYGIIEYQRFENCIECGSCMSACPVTTNFMGPAPLASIHREILKQKDQQEIGRLNRIAFSKKGVDACDKHFLCSKVCPTKVSPGKHINDLRKSKN